MIPEFFTQRPDWPGRIERIVESLGRVSALEELSSSVPELRRSNRIGSVHSSTAIEGNRLSLAEVEGVANGEAVFAPPRDVKEVENALAAYNEIEKFDPWNVDDFLRAHRMLTEGLIRESGAFRTVDVDIVGPAGQILHTGSHPEKVPRLVAELLEWGKASDQHPLIVSSAVHFLIEYIHPFRDGNGRIGRLWQTLILSTWRPVFAWMPTETLIRQHQQGYYDALQVSHDPDIDAAPFIDYMLGITRDSLVAYEELALLGSADGGIYDGISGGISESVIALLRRDSTLTASALATRLGKGERTVQRALASLQAGGRLRREGSRKTGRWIVIGETP